MKNLIGKSPRRALMPLAYAATLLLFGTGIDAQADPTVFADRNMVEQRAAAAQGTFTPEYFGLHIIDPDGSAVWPPANSFGSVRLWDNGVLWANLEPSRGTWSFETLDRLVAEAQAHNVKVLLTLGQTPGWASARPNEASPYSPGNAAEPRDFKDWQDYVRTVATRYKGRIEAYEIWNEVNAKAFWTGTMEQMAELEKEATAIIKTVDPAAKVVSANLTNTNRPSVDRFLDAGNGRYADIIGYHFYVQQSAPEEIVNSIVMVQAALYQHGLGNKPLWNTETGWLIPDDSGRYADPRAAKQWSTWRHLVPGEGVAFVSRALILGRMFGLQRFYWYGWDHGAFGLTADRGKTMRFAATSYLTTDRWLVGARFAGCSINGNLWSCRLERNNKTAWVAWAASGEFAIPGDIRKHAVAFEKIGDTQPEPVTDSTRIDQTPKLLLAQSGW